jgi:hypothetical protein
MIFIKKNRKTDCIVPHQRPRSGTVIESDGTSPVDNGPG